MLSSPRRAVAVAVPALALLAVAVPSASAAPVDVSSGATTLRLDNAVAKALTGAGVKVAPVSPAKAGKAGIAFPITGGSVDPATAKGTITHSGGLRLSAGKTRLSLTSFTVRIGAASTISAKVAGGARATLFRLGVKDAKITTPGSDLKVAGVVVRLSSAGAAALNKTFHVHLFTSGMRLGRATVQATPAVTFSGGTTSLALDPTTAAALTSLGVTPGVIAPATAAADGSLQFPIAAGSAVDAKTLFGTVRHTGGISLTAGARTVALTDFEVRIGKTPVLAAKVDGAGPLPILDLDLSGLQGPTVAGGTVTVGNVVARLTPAAATALNGAFATTAFTPGLTLGTATIAGTL